MAAMSQYRAVPPLPPDVVALRQSAAGTSVVTNYQKNTVTNLSDQAVAGATSLAIAFEYELPYFRLVHNGLTLAEGVEFDYVWADASTVQLHFPLEDTDVVLAIH